jgi:hypothetical protein
VILRCGFAQSKASGTLGNGVLNRFRVIFDMPASVVHLEPSPHWNKPFDKDRTGLGKVHRGDHLEVTNVATGSPAEKSGWKTGDWIIAIDGIPIVARHPNRLWSQRQAGSVVVVKKSDGNDYRLKLDEYY